MKRAQVEEKRREEEEEKEEKEKEMSSRRRGRSRRPANSSRSDKNTSSSRSSSKKKKKKKKGNSWRSADQIEDQLYYHGYLSRLLVEGMLKKAGDFVLRLNTNNQTEYILSAQSESRNLVHTIVRQRGDGKWTLGDLSSKSPVGLIDKYVKTKKILEVEMTGDSVRLRYPVGRSRWEIMHRRICLGRLIGRGAFGQVMQATLRRDDGTQEDVAVKVSELRLTRETIDEIMGEAAVMTTFKHANVVQFHGVAAERQPLMLVMELVSGGALDVKLREQRLDLVTKWNLCLDAARGLRHLHERGCIHRDIAARNCLITATGKLKIADFGMSQELKTGEKSYENVKDSPLPIKWMPPEALQSQKFTFESDIWAYGVLVWEIVSNGREPYGDSEASETVRLIMRGKVPSSDAGSDTTPAFEKLTRACWQKKPNRRPNFADICAYLEALEKLRWPLGDRPYSLPPIGRQHHDDDADKKNKKHNSWA